MGYRTFLGCVHETLARHQRVEFGFFSPISKDVRKDYYKNNNIYVCVYGNFGVQLKYIICFYFIPT